MSSSREAKTILRQLCEFIMCPCGNLTAVFNASGLIPDLSTVSCCPWRHLGWGWYQLIEFFPIRMYSVTLVAHCMKVPVKKERSIIVTSANP